MHLKHRIIHWFRHSFFFFGIMSILWVLFRSGAKPSRLVYPCQQAAAMTGYLWIATYLAFPLAALVGIRRWATSGKVTLMAGGFLFFGCILALIYITSGGVGAEPAGGELGSEIILPTTPSDIFVVQGKTGYNGGVADLLQLMESNGLHFYQYSDTPAPEGLIGSDDVVIIKVNSQWPERGGTNTDLVEAVIASILAHPEGFTGEIIVADNGQGRGSFSWPQSNAEDPGQTIQTVVDSFSGSHKVSTCLWDSIRNTAVREYDQGDIRDGYIVSASEHPRTKLKVSYPKFRTKYGTNISFRNGVWENGSYNNSRLKLINMPVLKSHSGYEVTASLKHYVGVVSVSLGDPHASIDLGGLGTALVETRYPELNILDATWINAVPQGYPGAGPATPYRVATRADTLAASTDPVALDYYAAKYILMPIAATAGYDTATMDPDALSPGYFGSWLRAAEREIRLGGFPVTSNESLMHVFIATGNSITISYPDGNEEWPQGSSQTIRWNYTGDPGPTVKIEALRGDTVIATVRSTPIGTDGSGSYSLVVPYETRPGSEFTIRVTSNRYPMCGDASDEAFTVTPAITLVTPNGGEQWIPGSSQTIRWHYTSDPGSTVRIEALRETTVIATIPQHSMGSDGTGCFNLIVPPKILPGSSYRIRVTSTRYPSCTDVSNAPFTVGGESLTPLMSDR
ncbi:MAG TPA: DUF362 domain-containing protein [Methanoregulaceae archaeon]|nr:DUF362 domain-containing protein [Methanoregulaceae archaeon]